MKVKNFAIVEGKDISIKDTFIVCENKNLQPKDNEKVVTQYSYGIINTDVLFSSGEVFLKFKFNNIRSGVLVIFETQNNDKLAIGLSYYNECLVIKRDGRNDEPLAKASKNIFFQIDREYELKISVSGSVIKLFIDNILMCELAINLKTAPITLRFTTEGRLEVHDMQVNTVKQSVFVIMQFTKEYNELYEDVIKPIVEHEGFICIRADEFYTNTPILKDIIDSIKSSSIIIAEITPDNPNVFYEIGYSHAIEKPTILLCDKKREKLPFDISSFRTLFYENTIAGKKKVEESLKKYLLNVK